MNLMKTPLIALMDMQPQRSHQIAWFVYGWIEREQVLNVTACANWWIQVVGLSAPQLKAHPLGIGNTVPQTEPQVSVHDSDRGESNRQGPPQPTESLS